MTNEEMAKHLTDFDPKLYEMHKENAWPEDEVDREKYEIALEMAEWKDEQFISMLPEIFDYFDNVVGLYDGGIDHSDRDKPEFIRHFSNKISNTK